MRNKSKTAKRLTGSIILIVVLALCLCLTTLAIVYDAMVSVENNIFTTGRVEINLNDGKAVYPEEMPLQVEPGATDQNEFFLKSEGTVSAYYRLYFSFNFDTENGELTQKGLAEKKLAENLDVKICKKGEKTPLYESKMIDFVKENAKAAEDVLDGDETQWFDIFVTLPESCKDDTMALTLTFNIHADAVQTKNNDGKSFQNNVASDGTIDNEGDTAANG